MKTSRILICGECAGTGLVGYSECVDYHKSIWRNNYTSCKRCDGMGRVIEHTEIEKLVADKLETLTKCR